jgi:hypothetical protein
MMLEKMQMVSKVTTNRLLKGFWYPRLTAMTIMIRRTINSNECKLDNKCSAFFFFKSQKKQLSEKELLYTFYTILKPRIRENTIKIAQIMADVTNWILSLEEIPLNAEMPKLIPVSHQIELAWFHQILCLPSNNGMNLQIKTPTNKILKIRVGRTSSK